MDRRQWSHIRSVLLVIIGWLVGWLVGKAVFSETTLRVFLMFCMKLGGYKGRKVTEPDFCKKFMIWRYSRKRLQISPKWGTLIFFSKTPLTILNLQFEWNLFFRKICNLNVSDHRWAWYLLVFLQFASPVSAFLFFYVFFCNLKEKGQKYK